MKTIQRFYYTLLLLASVCVCFYSSMHSEKYHIAIPIMFGVLSLLGLIVIIPEKKK